MLFSSHINASFLWLVDSITDASCWFLTSTTGSISKKLSTCCCLIWASQVSHTYTKTYIYIVILCLSLVNLSNLFSCHHLMFCPVCVYSNHRAPGVGVCYIWQWVEQCLCCGCRRPEDQSLLCRGRSVPPELEVRLRTTFYEYVFEIINLSGL